jgi:hypothetical protein
MIQITAQMRVLVAIEPVDGRKYAPSIDMRSVSDNRMSRAKPCFDEEQRSGTENSA